jgi:arylsulfatase A-like enzyme
MRSLSREVSVALWVLIGLGPFYFFSDTYQDFVWRYFTPGDPAPQVRAYALVCAQVTLLAFLEASFIRLVFLLLAVLSSQPRPTAYRMAARCAIVIVFAAAAVYQSSIVVSWLFFSETGRFLRPHELGLVRFSLDWTFLETVITAREWIYLLGAVVFAILSTVYLLSVSLDSARFSRNHELRRGITLAFTLGALAFASRALLPSVASAQLYSTILTNAPDCIAPQLAMFWSALLYRPPTEAYRPVPLQLRAAYSVDSYLGRAKQVDRARQNVIVVLVEALRDDVLAEHGGDPRIVPELNRLARSGLSFSAYAQAPETSESLLAMLSSLYPHKSVRRDSRNHWDFPHLFIYDLLARLGYRTAIINDEWSMDRSLLSSGQLDLHFDAFSQDLSGVPAELNPRLHATRYFGDYSLAVADKLKLRVLSDWIARRGDRPFFALVYFSSSHFPYEQPEGLPPLFTPVELSSEPSFLHYDRSLAPVMRNRYFNTLHYIDELLGDLGTQLERLGLEKNTLLIVTGDHGESFGEHDHVTHAGYLFEEAIKVPLLIHGAPGFEPEREGAVQLIDIPPTILSLLHLPEHDNYQGSSIVREAGSRDERIATPIFSSVQMLTHEDMVLVWPWKYVENARADETRLFNLAEDPAERSNLIGVEADRANALRLCLGTYRDSQLTYFADGSEYQAGFFPPRYRCDAHDGR